MKFLNPLAKTDEMMESPNKGTRVVGYILRFIIIFILALAAAIAVGILTAP